MKYRVRGFVSLCAGIFVFFSGVGTGNVALSAAGVALLFVAATNFDLGETK